MPDIIKEDLFLQWVSLIAQLVKNLPAMRRPHFDSWVGMIPWRGEWLLTPVFCPGEFQDAESGATE